MKEEKLNQFKKDIKSALDKALSSINNEDVKIFYLVVVANYHTPSNKYTELAKTLVEDYDWSNDVVEENLSNEIGDVVADYAKENDLEYEEDEDEELECCFDTFEDGDEYDDAEVVTFPTSQYVLDFPNYRQHAQLINSEEGLDKFGSSAYLVETSWLNDFRNAQLYWY